MAVEINGDGLITVDGTTSTQGRVRLKEDADNGTNYVELTAPASVTANRTITFPDDTGTVLTNSGNQTGVFSALTVNSNNISADNSLGFRNRIINGAMMIDQRNAGASVNIGSGVFPIDRWRTFKQSSATITGQRSATAPAGFINSLLFTTTSAASPASGNEDDFWQVIEGYNIADLGWGTSNAQTVTISFWVKVNNTGTYSGAVGNLAGNRSYPFSFTVSTTNWEQKTITVPGDQSGTWATDNTGGLYLYFNLNSGTTLLGTANAWVGSYKIGVTGSTNIGSIASATFYITGVQLEVGSVATPFERRPYGTELALCQRYLPVSDLGTGGQNLCIGMVYDATRVIFTVPFQVSPRTFPTGLTYTGTVGNTIIYIANATKTLTSIAYNAGTYSTGCFLTDGSSGLTGANAALFSGETASARILWTGCEL